MAADGRLLGLVAIADRIKPDAAEAVARLKDLGMRTVMLTGDNERTARAVAAQVGIDEVRAQVLPDQKAARIRELQAGGTRVGMVGDGINDAPALMQADVGIAIGAGTDIAIESSDVVIMGDRLGAVPDTYEISTNSYHKTKQNLALAFVFNGIGVPASATGLVSPVFADAGDGRLGHRRARQLLRRPASVRQAGDVGAHADLRAAAGAAPARAGATRRRGDRGGRCRHPGCRDRRVAGVDTGRAGGLVGAGHPLRALRESVLQGLSATDGVLHATVDVDAKTVRLRLDTEQLTLAEAQERLRDLGYEPTEVLSR